MVILFIANSYGVDCYRMTPTCIEEQPTPANDKFHAAVHP